MAEIVVCAQAPTIASQPTNRAVWVGANVNFAVTVSGAGPFSYQWQLWETNLPSNIITTVAGIGIGDRRPATKATLHFPYSVAVDNSGNLFIADSSNYRVRKVDANGIITTVVGNGTSGYFSDGITATNATIGMPRGVAVDASGNLFVTENLQIRKVDTNGVLTTLAGNGSFGFSGDGGAATNASLNGALGLALDSLGNLYFADSANMRIRKVDTDGVITTVAGQGVGGFSGDGGDATNASLDNPSGVAVDGSGNLFIADTRNDRIRKVSANGIITTVAGNGAIGYWGEGIAATNSGLTRPEGVSVDPSGALLIADQGDQRIRKVDVNGIITTVAGNGIYSYFGDGGFSTNASLANPKQMALDSMGNLFIAEEGNNIIRKVSVSGIITTVTGQESGGLIGDRGPATRVSFWYPGSVVVSPLGELFIADRGNHRICKVSGDGTIRIVAGNGKGGYAGDGGAATNAQLYLPDTVTLDVQGNLFISDGQNRRIRKVSTNGIIITVAGNGTFGYSGDGGAATNASFGPQGSRGLAMDALGNLFIADYFNGRIRKVDTNGIIRTVAGGGSNTGDGVIATNAALSGPTGIALDSSGNLVIASLTVNLTGNRVRKLNTNGIISTLAGNGTPGYSGDGGPATNATLSDTWGVVTDSSGNVFIADYGNHVVRRVNPAGIIETVAGTGTGNYSGDGGPAADATLCHPAGMAADQFGNLFVADLENHCIRKVTNTQRPTLALNNVSTSDAGNYRVVVTSASGSETSRVASLTVANSPLIYDTVLNSDGSLTINCVSPPNSTNVLLTTTDLTSPSSWQPVSTNVADVYGNWQFTETNTINVPARFYRSFSQSP